MVDSESMEKNSQKEKDKDDTFKIGIASFAHMHAWSYLNALESCEDVEIIGVAEENQKSKAQVKDLNYPYYDTYSELCENPDIDCILITTENCYHAQVAIEALNNNKHIIVEKPIATTQEDAQRMIQAADKSEGIMAQCYPCRYHPTSQKIKKICDDGGTGKIMTISATNHGRMPVPRGTYSWFSDKKLAGGGALMDHITHVADLIFWFTGADLYSVYAVGNNLFHPERDIDDAGMVYLEFSNGMKVSLDPSWSRPENYATWGDLTMTIFGTEKILKLDMFAQSLDIQTNNTTHPNWMNYGSNMDALMLRDFIDHLKQGKEPMLTGEDGKKALEVVLAAYESAKTGKKIHIHNGNSRVGISNNLEDLINGDSRSSKEETVQEHKHPQNQSKSNDQAQTKVKEDYVEFNTLSDFFSLTLTKYAWEKCKIVVKGAFEELGQAVESYWLLLGDNIVRDIIVPKQDVSFAFVHVDSENILDMKNEIHANKLNILGWGHSHANFGVFFSGTDVRNQERTLHETNNYRKILKVEESEYGPELNIEPDKLIKFSYGSTINIDQDKYAEIIWTDESQKIYTKKIPLKILETPLNDQEKKRLNQFKQTIRNRFQGRI